MTSIHLCTGYSQTFPIHPQCIGDLLLCNAKTRSRLSSEMKENRAGCWFIVIAAERWPLRLKLLAEVPSWDSDHRTLAAYLQSPSAPFPWPPLDSAPMVVHAGLDFVDRGLEGRAITEWIDEAQGVAAEIEIVILKLCRPARPQHVFQAGPDVP